LEYGSNEGSVGGIKMADNTVRIVLKIGEMTIELEGPKSYVDKKLKEPDGFDLLITKMRGIEQPLLQRKKKQEVKKEKKTTKVSRVEGYEMVKDLVLAAEGDKPSLKEFYSEKKPSSNYEHNVLFSYYLLKIREIKQIGINHIYTCYKEVSKRVPKLSVSLSETSRKGWLDTSNMNDIKITPRGENYIEHDLPKAKKVK
jgi:hypothetical protein